MDYNKNNKEHSQWNEKIKKDWIINGIDDEAINFADRFGKYLKDNKMTTSQIRNIFGEVKRIQLSGYEKNKVAFKLLKPKVAYMVGREKKEVLKKFKKVFDDAHSAVNDESTYDNFVAFLEAIIAYHKYYGGK